MKLFIEPLTVHLKSLKKTSSRVEVIEVSYSSGLLADTTSDKVMSTKLGVSAVVSGSSLQRISYVGLGHYLLGS